MIGAYYQLPPFADKSVVETYLLDFDVDPPSSNLAAAAHWTAAGARAYRMPKPSGGWGYEAEGVWEWGRAGGTLNGATRSNLEQNAYLVHLEAGYAFDARIAPDLARAVRLRERRQGPERLDDRAFQLAVRRAQLRLRTDEHLRPDLAQQHRHAGLAAHVDAEGRAGSRRSAYRWLFLAEARDQWVGSGWSDPTGRSGRTIGKQLEGSFTWTAIPNRLSVEPGFAHLELGRFARQVQGAAFRGDPLYFYLVDHHDVLRIG